jgi:hypothetical protein
MHTNGELSHKSVLSPETIRAATAEIFHGAQVIRDAVGAPDLLAEARTKAKALEDENVGLKAEIDRLRSEIAKLQATPVVIEKRALDEIMMRLERVEGKPSPPASLVAPLPKTDRPAKRSGRQRNEALDAYLRAGHYKTQGNHTIAKIFKVSENTVRKHMWELGLKREKQIRRKRGSVKAKTKR